VPENDGPTVTTLRPALRRGVCLVHVFPASLFPRCSETELCRMQRTRSSPLGTTLEQLNETGLSTSHILGLGAHSLASSPRMAPRSRNHQRSRPRRDQGQPVHGGGRGRSSHGWAAGRSCPRPTSSVASGRSIAPSTPTGRSSRRRRRTPTSRSATSCFARRWGPGQNFLLRTTITSPDGDRKQVYPGAWQPTWEELFADVHDITTQTEVPAGYDALLDRLRIDVGADADVGRAEAMS
jgi:hypothetical protein